MVDVWLLFNLLYPFIVVLLHTYMDSLRNDDEREINHHGRTITVDENNDQSQQGFEIKVLTIKITFLGFTQISGSTR